MGMGHKDSSPFDFDPIPNISRKGVVWVVRHGKTMKWFDSLIKFPLRKWLTFPAGGISASREAQGLRAVFLSQKCWRSGEERWLSSPASYGPKTEMPNGTELSVLRHIKATYMITERNKDSQSIYYELWKPLFIQLELRRCSWEGWPNPETRTSPLSLGFPFTCLLLHGFVAPQVPPPVEWAARGGSDPAGYRGVPRRSLLNTATLWLAGSTRGRKRFLHSLAQWHNVSKTFIHCHSSIRTIQKALPSGHIPPTSSLKYPDDHKVVGEWFLSSSLTLC